MPLTQFAKRIGRSLSPVESCSSPVNAIVSFVHAIHCLITFPRSHSGTII